MAASKIDWIEARKYYLRDNTVSYRDVAEKFGVSKKAVETHASVDGWAFLRQSLGERSIQRVEAEIVDKNTEINEKHGRHYRNAQALVSNLLIVASNTLKKKIEEKGADNLTIYEEGIITPARLKYLVESMKIAIDGERVTVGLPTSVERKEVTGKDGSDLFAKADTDKLYRLMDSTVKAIAERGSSSTDGASDSSGERDS